MKFIYTILLCFSFQIVFSQIQFAEVATNAGVGEDGTNYGASVVDFDDDGWDDIYLTRTPGANRLFKNNGDGTFTDIAEMAGVAYEGSTRTALWGDFNNDGCIDLFLANAMGVKDKLYLNKCDGTFKDISSIAGIEDIHLPQAAVLGDVNNDGFLDIYLAHQDGGNILWMNNGVDAEGNISFSNETHDRGVSDYLIAMGAMFFDYDNDLDLDLYLTHDGYGPNYLFQNDGEGYFENVAPQTGADIAAFGMGCDFGDINNDGWFEIYITNLYPNNLLLNNTDGTFFDITNSVGIDIGDNGMGWGVSFLDVDNDTYQDFYFANTAGSPNVLFHNQGSFGFQEISSNTTLASEGNNFAVATLDYNNDGKIDFFVTNSNHVEGNHLFENETINDNHWVKIKTEGTVSNRSGIGARVEVILGDTKCVDMVTGGSGWSSQNSLTLHFGLGEATVIDTIKVMWQTGVTDILTNVAVDETYTIVESENIPTSVENVLEKDFDLKVFPNPVSDVATVEFDLPQSGEVSVSIFDVNGRLVDVVFEGLLGEGKKLLEIDLDRLENGIYFIELTFPIKTIYEKILRIN